MKYDIKLIELIEVLEDNSLFVFNQYNRDLFLMYNLFFLKNI